MLLVFYKIHCIPMPDAKLQRFHPGGEIKSWQLYFYRFANTYGLHSVTNRSIAPRYYVTRRFIYATLLRDRSAISNCRFFFTMPVFRPADSAGRSNRRCIVSSLIYSIIASRNDRLEKASGGVISEQSSRCYSGRRVLRAEYELP